MARRRRDGCGVCGVRHQAGKPFLAFAVRDGARWVLRFTYPQSAFKPDKDWLESEGTGIGSACKAILGEGAPFVWHGEHSWQSAAMIAEHLGGAAVVEWLCGKCSGED